MIDETLEPSKTWLPARADSTPVDTQKLGLELLIGSNMFRNTNGVVKVHGREQLVLEPKPEEGLLLLTIDLYDDSGNRIAHVRRNMFALNQAAQFTIDVHRAHIDSRTDVPWIRLSNQQSGEIVLEARVLSENKAEITSGKFHSHRGILVEVTPHYCRIGSSMKLFGDIVENRGRTVVLG